MNIGKVRFGNIPRIAAVIIDCEDKNAITSSKRDDADILELRIDCFKKRDLANLIKTIKNIKNKRLPIIATIRSKREGGNALISDIERHRLFIGIMPFVDAVDIELSSSIILKDVVKEAHRLKKKVIISYHNFKNTPETKKLEAIIKDSIKAGGDIVKIAAFAKNKKDIINMASLTLAHKNIITISMGRLGAVSRVLFPMLGSLLTYCSTTKSSAPGQLPLKDTVTLLKQFSK